MDESMAAVKMISCVRYIDANDEEWRASLDPWFAHFLVLRDIRTTAYTYSECIPEHEEGGVIIRGRWNRIEVNSTVEDELMPGLAINPHALDRVLTNVGNPATDDDYEVWTFAQFESAFDGSHVLEDAL